MEGFCEGQDKSVGNDTRCHIGTAQPATSFSALRFEDGRTRQGGLTECQFNRTTSRSIARLLTRNKIEEFVSKSPSAKKQDDTLYHPYGTGKVNTFECFEFSSFEFAFISSPSFITSFILSRLVFLFHDSMIHSHENPLNLSRWVFRKPQCSHKRILG